jgi:glutamate racemase
MLRTVGKIDNMTHDPTPQSLSRNAPIGVFDSGVGGLTVLRALIATLPAEDFVYLGDTARLPYGTKSPGSIRQYSLQAARLLRRRGVKCLVVACNTASATALDALTAEFAPIPVIGVLEPGAAAACASTRSRRIAVLATEGTVRGGAYQAAIARRLPDAVVTARACPLFVALAEEGWIDGPIVTAVIHRYLDDVFVAGAPAAHPDTLVLGCTHFPVFAAALRKVVGPDVAVVDSAATTADSLAALLASRGRAHSSEATGTLRLLATDGPERFARVSEVFGIAVTADEVDLVDLAQPASAPGTS